MTNTETIKGFNNVIHLLINNIFYSLHTFQGVIIFLCIIIIFAIYVFNKSCNEEEKRRTFIITWLSIPLGVAHLLFGQYGWFSRYEVYAISFLVISIIIIIPKRTLYYKINRLMIYLILFLIGLPYLNTTLMTPMASYGIYLQHYQMHRFVVDYWDKPVAVNDLGLVSYQNPNYVLDLWGLGSEEVRNLKELGKFNAVEIDNIVKRKNIQLVIIYDGWFKGSIPKHWVKVAELHTIDITAASGNVSFYSTKNEYVNEIYNEIKEFANSIPSNVNFSFK